MSDQEGWSELCDLHLAEGDYNRAAFCAEELILHNPHNYFVHQRLADIRYTMGGIENLKMAVSYYSQALKLNPDNMRAIFGLFLSASSLSSNQRVPASEKKDHSKVASWAKEQVSQKYARSNELKDDKAEVEMLEGVFGTLQITSS
jgi:tetratricopeptide (TPR) repeat protein